MRKADEIRRAITKAEENDQRTRFNTSHKLRAKTEMTNQVNNDFVKNQQIKKEQLDFKKWERQQHLL